MAGVKQFDVAVRGQIRLFKKDFFAASGAPKALHSTAQKCLVVPERFTVMTVTKGWRMSACLCAAKKANFVS